MTWANPLLLSCVFNRQTTTINVEDLVANDCKSKAVTLLNGQIKTRYNITLCGGADAEGTIEVQGADGSWFFIDQFSTKNNCTLFRKISTNYPCHPNRFGHNGGCGEF